MEPGRRVAHYEIEEAVGRGGMGVVYRARDTKLGRTVALKFLPPGTNLDPRAKDRFVREARAASSLDHPNICTIHDIAETDEGLLYIVMAYYEGRTLAERLVDEEFPVERCLAIGRQLAAALDRAHESGIVHRDLKPGNVMILDGDEVKLLDFGVAKLTTGEDDLTATGGTVGTIAYMSPEQLRGADVDRRTDLWALGAILYEMLAGRRPFTGETGATVITSILERTPASLASLRADVPPHVAAVIRRCLEKDRDRRPERAAEIGTMLRREDTESEATRTMFVDTRSGTAPVRRRALRIGVPLALLVVAVLVAWTALTRGPSTAPDAAATGDADDVLAVVPFTVRGNPELDYLGEGIVDVLSARLDGIGGITTVDPRVVISRVREERFDLESPETGARLAARVGAGRYVTGDLLEVGGRVTLTAALHRAGDATAPPSRASVEGNAADVLDLLDGLIVDLVTGTMSEPGERLTRTAAMTSHSLEATKAYLRGERYLRAGRYREAAEAYDEAVGLDPDFALAHYRKSIAADWIDAYDIRSSVERAWERADRLPPRERALLAALRLRRNGRNHEAEQAYRAILHRDPDDVEALTQLAETLFHDNPRLGRSTFESVDPFRRVLELEPANANARIHLARLYALDRDLDALRETAVRFAEESSESERAAEVASLLAFTTDDPAAQDAVVARLAGLPPPHQFYAAHGASRFARSPDGARRILDAGGSTHPLLLSVRAGLDVEQGRLAAFDAFLDAAPGTDSPSWDLYRAFVRTSDMVPDDPARLRAVYERLRGATPEDILETSWLPPYEDVTPAFVAFERDHGLAMLAIRLGRLDEARERMDGMRAMGPFEGLGSVQGDALLGLAAEIAVREGDDEAALEALRAIEYEIPHAITVRSVGDGARSRYLRAVVEARSGDPRVAEAYWRGLDESWSWWDTVFRPGVYRGLADLARREGRTDEALRWLTRFVALRDGCDPVFRSEVDEARSALAALRP